MIPGGLKRGWGHNPCNIRAALGYLELAPDPSGESGLGAVTHSLGAGWGDALPAVRGGHHASPLETSGDGGCLGRGTRPVGR